ncbi:helix-turn-helix domain-containing protein [Streptomyces sp. NPDC002209]|uniref:helix-turn-helix domain-containing protein n=1 Tax=Streptomyces sp. NPDC002209 TaxID=3364638 RepID=UPI003696F881
MTGVVEGGTGEQGPVGGPSRSGRRPLKKLNPKLFEERPHKLVLVRYLRSLIEAADLASKNVAPGAATSPATLSRNLSGERLPQRSTVEAIIRLCEATDEVRAQVLRLHTAALGEAYPAFADRLVMADAYEETVLRHDRVQNCLKAVTEEHRRQQADYDDLLARHETTRQAFAAAQDELRTRRRHHQEETARISSLLREEQDARRRDRTDSDARLHQAQAEAEKQLRAREEEEARLRQDLHAQKDKINTLCGRLEDSAAEASALRHERDQLRVESARLRENLVGLQVDLAAAEAAQEKQSPHAQETMAAPVSQSVGHALDRHPATREDDEAAGQPALAGVSTRATAGDGDPRPAPASSEADPKSVKNSDGLWEFTGGAAVSLVLICIGLNQHTGPADDLHLTTAGWWCTGSGFFLLLSSAFFLAVHEARNSTAAPGGTYDPVYSYEPMA